MPELGGLHEIADIKALILYLLKEANCVLKEGQLTDVIMADGLVEYFDYAQSVEELLIAGLIDIASLEEMSSYRITKRGYEAVDEFEKKLPHNVKATTLVALQDLLKRKQEEEDIRADIEASRSGFTVTCTVREAGEIMLSCKVLVPDRKAAFYAAERFRQNPSAYYQKIMELMLDENPFQ